MNLMIGAWAALLLGGCSSTWPFGKHSKAVIEKVVPQKVLDSDVGDVVEGISDLYLPEPVGDALDGVIDSIYDDTLQEMIDNYYDEDDERRERREKEYKERMQSK